MEKVNLSNLIVRSKCERKGYLDTLNLGSYKGRNYHLSVAASKAIANRRSDKKFIKGTLPEDLYILKEAEDKAVDVLSYKIDRYLKFLLQQNIIQSKRVMNVEVNKKTVPVNVDNVIEHASFIEVSSIRTGKTHMSYRARKPENMPENSIELYFLYLAGQTLPESIKKGKPIVASIHYLTSKNETSKKLDEAFNEKRGSNIIVANSFSKKVIEDVTRLLSQDANLSIPEKCDMCDYCDYSSLCELDLKEDISFEEVEEMQDKAGKGFAVTKDQEKAILFSRGIARINAGAGSGKTTVISLRIVELIKNGCEPEDILLITFTNKGAQEMRDKIAFWLDKENMNDISIDRFNIMTFNAWGAEIVEDNYKILGYTKEPELAERVEKYDIIINLLKNYPEKIKSFNYDNPLMRFFHGRGVVVELEMLFDFIKGHYIQNVEQFKKKGHYSIVVNPGERDGRNDYDRVFDLYEAYIQELKDRNLIEYQDQVNHALYLSENHPSKLNGLNYTHVIVDEFQDSDSQQLDLIRFLTKQNNFQSLMVVGDDSQSIFGFRNTSQEIILNFDSYFSNVIDISITENFRSTEQILTLANAINDINTNKLEKELISGGKQGNIPTIINYKNETEEYADIAKLIKSDIDNGIAKEEIAILGRTKAELIKINQELIKLDIPSIIDIPEPFIKNQNLHILKSISSFINDRSLTAELFKYMYVVEGDDFRSMEQEQMKAYIDNAAKLVEYEIMEDGYSRIDENGEMIGNPYVELNNRKMSLLCLLSQHIKDEQLEEFITEIEDKFDNFYKLNEYLSKLILYEDPRSIQKDDIRYQAVTLTTAHSSKGREWDKVYLTINKFTPMGELEEVEEERRLLFVALTRAKNDLVVTSKKFTNISKGYRNKFAVELEQTGLIKLLDMQEAA